jgi:hypothetical protein
MVSCSDGLNYGAMKMVEGNMRLDHESQKRLHILRFSTATTNFDMLLMTIVMQSGIPQSV